VSTTGSTVGACEVMLEKP